MNHSKNMALTAWKALDETKGRDIGSSGSRRYPSSQITLSLRTAAVPAR